MPLLTIASAVSRMSCSLTLQANLFQLFQPIGGVCANELPGADCAASAPLLQTIPRANKIAIRTCREALIVSPYFSDWYEWLRSRPLSFRLNRTGRPHPLSTGVGPVKGTASILMFIVPYGTESQVYRFCVSDGLNHLILHARAEWGPKTQRPGPRRRRGSFNRSQERIKKISP